MRVRKFITILLLILILAAVLAVGSFLSKTDKYKQQIIENILGIAIEKSGLEGQLKNTGPDEEKETG